MAYNINVNDDFYSTNDNQQQYTTTNPFNNSNLDFAPMPPAPPNNQQQQPQQFFSHSSNQQQQQAFYSPPTQQANNTNFYNDWSSQTGSIFNPVADKSDPFTQQTQSQFTGTDIENEAPLLEELGINFEHIYMKTKCVLNPFAQPDVSIIHDEDLAGPLVFCIAYGFSLLLMGKIQFGYIYGITLMGCMSMYCLLNLMSETGVTAICIGSTLGYCLLPMVFLSFIGSVVALDGMLGMIMSIGFILWCSLSSSKLFVSALNMTNQQALVLYPCFLLYGIFALLNTF